MRPIKKTEAVGILKIRQPCDRTNGTELTLESAYDRRS